MSNWDDPLNAEIYDQFARKHVFYRVTSGDLVELVGMKGAATVVDLACGTGITTEAILELIDPTSIVAIDGSEAMLEIARKRVLDRRVRWVNADGVNLAEHVTAADAITCNSAIWQMDMEASIGSAAKALRSGGKLAFNIARSFLLILPLSPEELRPSRPTLEDVIKAIAVLEHDFVPAHPASRRSRGSVKRRRLLTPGAVEQMLSDAGLVLDVTKELEYDDPAESQRDWISVPVFADNVLLGMPYDQQRRVISDAYERFDQSSVWKSRWFAWVAHRP